MPVKLPPKRGLPERFKRHAALRDLAKDEARSELRVLSRRQADARAKEMAKEPMPHTRVFWDSVVGPGEETC